MGVEVAPIANIETVGATTNIEITPTYVVGVEVAPIANIGTVGATTILEKLTLLHLHVAIL